MKKVYRSIPMIMLLCACSVFGASVILNEYNAVDSQEYLGGGTAFADESGGRASDSFFGRVQGNGGDWFELVVITDHLDMRNWTLDIYTDGVLDETLMLTDHSIWSDLRSGTIITVSEDVPSDISYDPAGGDWWINVQANDNADGLYIEASNFPVDSSNWQLCIKNAAGTVIFGPAGEGISPESGIGKTEIFRLEADPSDLITPFSIDYDDGSELSTFGSPNQWGQQNFGGLRTLNPPFSTLTLLSPNGAEIFKSGRIVKIKWSHTGTVNKVNVEFSQDAGATWAAVYPPNVGNEGVYSWQVPQIDSDSCLIRISNAADSLVYDTSDSVFSVYQCSLAGDVSGDCVVNFEDFVLLASSWLQCANPYDPTCW